MPNDQKSIKPNAARKQAPRKQNLDNKPIKKVGDGTMGFMLWSIAGTVLASCSSPIFSDVADLTGGGGGGNAQSGPPGFVTNGRWANTNVFLADENGARVSGSDAVGITDGAGSIILNDGISLIAGQQYMAALEGGIEISTNRLGVSGEELLSLPYVSGEALIISPLTDLLARQLMDSTNAAEVDAMGQDAFIQKVLNDIFGERPQFDDAGAAIVELDANGDRMEGEFVNPTPQVTLADVLEADNYNAFVNDDTVTRLVSLASNELGVSPGTGSVGDLMTLFDDARTLVESEADEATLETQLDAQLVLIKQVFDARDDTTTANSRPVAANPNEGDPISMTEDQNFTVVRGNAETLFGFEDPFGNAGAADGARVDGEFEGIYIEAASMGGDVAVMFRLEDDTIVDLDDQRAVTARGAPSDGASPAMTTIDSVRFYYISEANFGQLVLMPDPDFNTASINNEDNLPQIRFYVYDGEHATVDNGGSLNGIGTLKISVDAVNDAPVVTDPAAVSITSNTDSASGTFTASDIDGDMDFRWTATPTSTSYGTFGFTDSQGAWTFTLNEAAFDALPAGMDVPLTFDITAIDGNGGVSAPVTLTIMLQGQNDAPTDITTSVAALTASYDDNPGIPSGGIFIATLSTEDVDAGDTHTYTRGGVDGQYFSIRDGNGVVSTEGTHLWLDDDADARAVDGTWEVEVTSTDAGNERTSKTFTITRTDANINAAPTDITTDVAGASAALTATYDGDDVPTGGHVVAVLDSTDPNTSDTHTYSIVPNDNGPFTIRNGNQLVLREGAASPAPGGTLDVTVRSTDAGTGTGGLTFDKTFTITRAGNVSPTDITTTGGLTITYDGNVLPSDGRTVLTLGTTDLNAGDTHTYSITGGMHAPSFAISGNELQLATSGGVSVAPSETWEVTVRTTDAGTGAGGLFHEETFTFTRAGNVPPPPPTNVAPTDITTDVAGTASAFTATYDGDSVPDGGHVVAVLDSTDTNTSDTHSYVVTGGADMTSFTILNDNELVLLDTATSPAPGGTLEVTVTSTDAGTGAGGLTFDKTFTITRAGNVSPTDITTTGGLTITYDGNVLPSDGRTVLTLGTTDLNAGDSHTYSITGGMHAPSFAISGNELQLATSGGVSVAPSETWEVTVRTTDAGTGAGGLFHEETFTFTRAGNVPPPPPTNVAPTDITTDVAGTASAFTATYDGDSVPDGGHVVAVLDSTDPNTSDTHSYVVTGGADMTSFTILNDNELVLLDTATSPAPGGTLEVTVTSTDAGTGAGGLTFDKTFTITRAGNVSPTDITTTGGLTITYDGNVLPSDGRTVLTLGTTDLNAGDTHTYSITGGMHAPSFAISGNELQLATSGGVSVAPSETWEVTVRTTDAGTGAGGLFHEETFTFTRAGNVPPPPPTNVAPTDITTDVAGTASAFTATYDGDSVPDGGHVVAVLDSTDTNTSDTHSYVVTGGADMTSFTILNDNELVLLDTAISPAPGGTLEVTVTSTDAGTGAGGLTFDKTFTITRAGNVSPTDITTTGGLTITYDGNVLPSDGRTVLTLGTTDLNAGDSHTYSITGGMHAPSFAISGNELQLATSGGVSVAPSETWEVTVRTTDAGTGAGGLFHEETFTFTRAGNVPPPPPTNVAPTDITTDVAGTASAFTATYDGDSVPDGGHVVAVLDSTDTNTSDTHSYVVTGGADMTSFTILNDNELVLLDTATSPAPGGTLEVTVTSTDAGTGAGGLTFDKTFTITRAGNVSPTDITTTGGLTITYDGNVLPSDGRTVLTLGTTDLNAGDTHTYSITGGMHAPSFAISGNELQLATSGGVSVAPSETWEVTVRTTDAGTGAGGLFHEETFTFTRAGNVPPPPPTNVAPTDITTDVAGTASAFTATYDGDSVPDGGHVVAVLDSTDTNTSDTHSYVVTGGADMTSFTILNDNELVLLDTAISPAPGGTLDVTVTSTDAGTGAGGLTFDKTFTITRAGNVSPTDITTTGGLTITYDGNVLPSDGRTVLTLGTTDLNAGDTHTYSITGGMHAPSFAISGNELQLATSGGVSVAPSETWEVTVRTTDAGTGAGGLFHEETFTFTRAGNVPPPPPTNVAPTDITTDVAGTASAFTATYDGDSVPDGGHVVAVLDSTDPNTSDTHSYVVTGGANMTSFTILNDNELVLLDTATSPAPGGTLEVTVTSTDAGTGAGGLTVDKTFTITRAGNVSPTDITTTGGLTITYDGNVLPSDGRTVLTLGTTDLNAGDSHTYSITGGMHAPSFAISGNELQLATSGGVSVAPSETWEVTVRTTDAGTGAGGLFHEETFTFTRAGNAAPDNLVVTNEAVRAFVVINGVEFRINADSNENPRNDYKITFTTTSQNDGSNYAANGTIELSIDNRISSNPVPFSQARIARLFDEADLTGLDVVAIILEEHTGDALTETDWTGSYDLSTDRDLAVTEDDTDDRTAGGFLQVTGATDRGDYTYTGDFEGKYGDLKIDPNGNWTYIIDNTDPLTQGLDGEMSDTDDFTVTVRETGGAMRTEEVMIRITVNGVDEPTPAPVFSGASEPTGTVTDTDTAFDNTPDSLMGRSILLDAVTGVISWSVDTPVVAGDTSESAAYFGELTFPGSVFVNFGTAFDRTGSGLPWQFDPTTGINDLGAGQSVTITYAVTASNAGGSAPQDLVITLMGIDDAPEITAGLTGSSASADGATGRITATDVDGDTITFADSTNADYGDLTFSRVGITDEYEWTLDLNTDGEAALAALGDGVTQDITFEITAATGGTETTTETLTIELTGTASDNLVVTNEAVRAFVIVKGVEFRVNTDSRTTPPSSYELIVNTSSSEDISPLGAGGNFNVFASSADSNDLLPANIARIFDEAMLTTGGAITNLDIAAIILEEDTTKFLKNERHNFILASPTLDDAVTEDDAADNTARGFLEVMGAAEGDTYTYTGGSTRDIGTGRNKVTYQIFEGMYGELIVDGDGNWTYVLDNTDPLTQGLDDGMSDTDDFAVTVSETGGAMRTEEVMIEITVNGAADADPSLDVTNEAVRAFVVINGVEFRVNDDSNEMRRDDYKISFTASATKGASFGSGRDTISLTIDNGNANNFSQANIALLFDEADLTGLDVVAIILEENTGDALTETDWTGSYDLSTDRDLAVTEDDTDDRTAGGFLQVTGATDRGDYTYTGDFEGKYGDLKIDPNGNWTYIIDNTDPLTQGLDGEMSDTDDFTVTVRETGGAMRTEEVMIRITVNGADEEVATPLVVTSQSTDTTVTEDDAADTTATGAFVVTDPPAGATYTYGGVFSGTYGNLTVDANGTWTYTIDNAATATQALIHQQTRTDTITVTITEVIGSETGRSAPQTIDITVTGKDEPLTFVVDNTQTERTITDATTASDDDPDAQTGAIGLNPGSTFGFKWNVVKLADMTTLLEGRTIPANTDFGTISFPDPGGTNFVALGTPFDAQEGPNFSILPLDWSFDPTDAINLLDDGESVVLTYEITAMNRGGPTTQNLVITLTGRDDAPEITGGLTGSSAGVNGATGTITATDIDGDTITFADSTNSAYGDLTFSRVGSTDEYEWTLDLNTTGEAALAALGEGDSENMTFSITATGGTEPTTETLTIELTPMLGFAAPSEVASAYMFLPAQGQIELTRGVTPVTSGLSYGVGLTEEAAKMNIEDPTHTVSNRNASPFGSFVLDDDGSWTYILTAGPSGRATNLDSNGDGAHNHGDSTDVTVWVAVKDASGPAIAQELDIQIKGATFLDGRGTPAHVPLIADPNRATSGEDEYLRGNSNVNDIIHTGEGNNAVTGLSGDDMITLGNGATANDTQIDVLYHRAQFFFDAEDVLIRSTNIDRANTIDNFIRNEDQFIFVRFVTAIVSEEVLLANADRFRLEATIQQDGNDFTLTGFRFGLTEAGGGISRGYITINYHDDHQVALTTNEVLTKYGLSRNEVTNNIDTGQIITGAEVRHNYFGDDMNDSFQILDNIPQALEGIL